jgi:nucleoid-associated protein YgaU
MSAFDLFVMAVSQRRGGISKYREARGATAVAEAKELSRKLQKEILRLLAERGEGKTICPSEAARAVAGSDTREQWEPLMEPARAAAQQLVSAGKIVVTQHGAVVDGRTAKGPIRLRLR